MTIQRTIITNTGTSSTRLDSSYDNIYKYLIMFEKIYDDLSDMEKKEFVV